MLFTRKHITVVLFSSVIIAVVFISTIVGYTLYIQWKKDAVALTYRNTIYRIKADILKDDIVISNIHARIADEGAFKGMPILEGTVENKTKKTVTSLLIEVSFVSEDGSVLYKDRVFPLGEGSSFIVMGETSRLFSPGGEISFKHLLRNCPIDVIKFLKKKGSFAKSAPGDEITMEYSIAGVSLS